jgi:RecA/RadA recombinase
MAIMFPTTLPDYVLSDPYREAEIEVYDALRDDVSDEFVCYYSRPWLGLDKHGFERDGEADFLIAHPRLGLLVVEVKGGGVSRQEGSEVWTSTNRHKIKNVIKDPVQQAVKSKHEILRKLKEQHGWGRRFITLRHGVILPDSRRPAHDLGPNMPLRIFLFAGEMKHLQEWIESRLSQRAGEEDAPGQGLDEDGMAILRDLVAGRIELRPSLARALRKDRKIIEVLSADQLDVLDGLEEHNRISVAGGAGTGKTILALEKAARLGEAGKKALLVCYNAPLGEHLRNVTKNVPNVRAGSFHSVCLEGARAGRLDLPAEGSPAFFSALPGALRTAAARDPSLKFDAVVIDEGQDFTEEWLEVIQSLLRDPTDGCLYVFFDDNQKLYERQSALLRQLAKPYHLTKNFRNTRAIHACTMPWYSGKLTRAVGPEGQDVMWVEAERPKDASDALSNLLRELTSEHGLAPDDIAVLTGGSTQNNAAVQQGAICGFPVCAAGRDAKGHIIFDTVRRFKGLDRAAVVVIDPGKLDDPELAYVALSRPSVLLAVVGGKRHLDRLKRGTDP